MWKTIRATRTATSRPAKAARQTRNLSTINEKKSMITGRADTMVDRGQA
jgi:hypothetical protein